jgi:hypothetical protein
VAVPAKGCQGQGTLDQLLLSLLIHQLLNRSAEHSSHPGGSLGSALRCWAVGRGEVYTASQPPRSVQVSDGVHVCSCVSVSLRACDSVYMCMYVCGSV